jgi:hypothetical protein
MPEELSSSETSVLTRGTRGIIQVDTILHSHRRENLKSYKVGLARKPGTCLHASPNGPPERLKQKTNSMTIGLKVNYTD